MTDWDAIQMVRDLTKHETYGDLFSLIEEIRRDHERNWVPRMAQMAMLFRLNRCVLQVEAEEADDGEVIGSSWDWSWKKFIRDRAVLARVIAAIGGYRPEDSKCRRGK